MLMFVPNVQKNISYILCTHHIHHIYLSIYTHFLPKQAKTTTQKMLSLLFLLCTHLLAQLINAIIIVLQDILGRELIVVLISHVCSDVFVNCHELGHTPADAHVFPLGQVPLVVLLPVDALVVALVQYAVELHIHHIKLYACSLYLCWVYGFRTIQALSIIDEK